MSPITHQTFPLVSKLGYCHRNSFRLTKSYQKSDPAPDRTGPISPLSPSPTPSPPPSSHVLVLGSHQHNNQPLSSVKTQQTKCQLPSKYSNTHKKFWIFGLGGHILEKSYRRSPGGKIIGF